MIMWVCAYLVLLIYGYRFISWSDQLRSEHKFIIMRRIIINGNQELIWLNRGCTHASYLMI
jgi:hypothetical protein